MKNGKYQIRYQHTAWDSAESKNEALRKVKSESRCRILHYVNADDGIYCYRSKADKDNDDTGAYSFAVICGPGQQD